MKSSSSISQTLPTFQNENTNNPKRIATRFFQQSFKYYQKKSKAKIKYSYEN